jgi:hypothetical protein
MHCIFRFSFIGLTALATFLAPNLAPAQSQSDDSCLKGEKKVGQAHSLGAPKDQGNVGVCSFYSGCALAESISPGKKPYSELYLILKHFETNPERLDAHTKLYWANTSPGILSGNAMIDVAQTIKKVGRLPVSKNPEEDRKTIEKIESELTAKVKLDPSVSRDRLLEQNHVKMKEYLEAYKDKWEWDSSDSSNFSNFNPRVVTGILPPDPAVKHAGIMLVELRRSQGIISDTLEDAERIVSENKKSSVPTAAPAPVDVASLQKKLDAYKKIKVADSQQTLKNLHQWVTQNAYGMSNQRLRDVQKDPDFYWRQAAQETKNIESKISSAKNSPPPPTEDDKLKKWEAKLRNYFSASSLENAARLSSEEYSKFLEGATAVKCKEMPYMHPANMENCTDWVNQQFLNIRNGLRHYQALKLARAKSDFSVPAVMNDIDDPKFNFAANTTLAAEMQALPHCSSESAEKSKRLLLKELCAGKTLMVADAMTRGFEANVLNPKTQDTTGRWKNVPYYTAKDQKVLPPGSHATLLQEYDPAEGGYFILRNSWGPRSSVLRIPVRDSCQIEEAIALDPPGETHLDEQPANPNPLYRYQNTNPTPARSHSSKPSAAGKSKR